MFKLENRIPDINTIFKVKKKWLNIVNCYIEAYRFRFVRVRVHEHGLEDRRACGEDCLVRANLLHPDPNREIRQQVVAE